MNNLNEKDVLIIYDGSNAKWRDYLGAWLAYQATEFSATLIDVDGLDDSVGTDEISDEVVKQSDNSFDYIFVTCAISDTGGSESMSYDTLATTWQKLKTSARGTALDTGTAQAAGSDTTHTELATGASTSNDYYNTMLIYTDGASSGSAQYKIVLDYIGSTLIAELGGAAQTATDGDGYTVYPMTNLVIGQDPSYILSGSYKYDSDITTYQSAHSAYPIPTIVWDNIRTSATSGYTNFYPKMIHTLSDINFYKGFGTASSGSTTTLVDSGIGWTVNEHAGRYVFIYEGTGAGQFAAISENDTDTLTCQYFNNKDKDGYPNYHNVYDGGETTWTSPDGTSDYFIIDGFYEILHNVYYQLYIKSFLNDLTDTNMQEIIENLVDKSGLLSYSGNLYDSERQGAPIQDQDQLDTALDRGLALFKGVVVSAALTEV